MSTTDPQFRLTRLGGRDLTWQCDSASCEHETDIRHVRGAGVYCYECEQKRVKYSFDPEAEIRDLQATRAAQSEAVSQT